MTIEELLDVKISVASKIEENPIDAPGIVSVVPREEFELYGDRDLFQLLQRQPSIYTRRSFVFADNIAAFRGDMATHGEYHTLLLLNGRPIRESALGYSFPVYMAFPIDALSSVELIRGPGSVLYGTNAFTGVVNLRTRPVPETSQWSLKQLIGSYGYYDTTVTGAGKIGDTGYVTSFRNFGRQGQSYRMTDALGNYDSRNIKDESMSGMFHIDHKGLKLDVFAADLDVFSMGVQPFWSNPHHSSRTKRLFSNLGYKMPIHEKIDLEFNVTYNLQEDSLSSPASQRIGTNSSDLLGEVTLYTRPVKNANMIFGYLMEYRTNYSADSDHYQSIPSYHYKPQSFYAQGDYTIGGFIKGIAGLQWNRSGQRVTDVISRFGLIITPHKNWGFKLLRGEAFRAPVAMESDLYDPAILVGNSDLEPEKITTYDAQVFFHDEKTYLAFTYFTSEIEGLIIYDYSVTPTSYMNGGTHKYNGYEIEFKRYIKPGLQLIGSFMTQDNKADQGLSPSVAPETMVKLGTSYSWNGGSAAIFFSHFGDMPNTGTPPYQNPKPEALNLVSLNIRLDPSQWLDIPKGRATLTFKVENLFNEKVYVPTFAYTGSPNSFPYGAGTTFYAGLQINF
jgi:outer membrane receptor protein involved in Fe transport